MIDRHPRGGNFSSRFRRQNFKRLVFNYVLVVEKSARTSLGEKEASMACIDFNKVAGKREDQKAKTNDVVMLDHDNINTPQDDTPPPQHPRDDGYLFRHPRLHRSRELPRLNILPSMQSNKGSRDSQLKKKPPANAESYFKPSLRIPISASYPLKKTEFPFFLKKRNGLSRQAYYLRKEQPGLRTN